MSRRRTRQSSANGKPGDAELQDLIDEHDLELPIEELREFLSADFLEVPADPEFRNRLREKLWELVRSGAFGYGRTEDD